MQLFPYFRYTVDLETEMYLISLQAYCVCPSVTYLKLKNVYITVLTIRYLVTDLVTNVYQERTSLLS